jgi:hypothetical protein
MGLVLVILGGAILASPANAAQAAGPVQILSHTPFYVWALLALLVALGLSARRSRELPPWRVALLPMVFFLWGASGLVQRLAVAPGLALFWAPAALIGLALAWLGRRRTWRIDPDTRLVRLGGSWQPLIRNLAIFAAKYALAVSVVLMPDARPEIATADTALSGLMAGYFLGRLAILGLLWWRLDAPPPVPAESGR